MFPPFKPAGLPDNTVDSSHTSSGLQSSMLSGQAASKACNIQSEPQDCRDSEEADWHPPLDGGNLKSLDRDSGQEIIPKTTLECETCCDGGTANVHLISF